MESIKHLLGKRADGFQCMWDTLKKMNKESYLIVETGTTRIPDNWEGDGQSTRIWDMFVKENNGRAITVDICPYACEVVKGLVSDNVSVVCDDSVHFLHTFEDKNKIDLLYLDSYDIDFNNPHNSSFHHIKELTAVFSSLKPSCLIAVDDNIANVGKGKYVREFLECIGYNVIHDGYQIVMSKGLN
jgi:predicted methyltransferase